MPPQICWMKKTTIKMIQSHRAPFKVLNINVKFDFIHIERIVKIKGTFDIKIVKSERFEKKQQD